MNHNFSKPQLSTSLDDWWVSWWSQQKETWHNLQSSIYRLSTNIRLSDQHRVWLVKYKWNDFTFAYSEAVWAIYEQQHIQCINFDNFSDFTSYLKRSFEDYSDLCPNLWTLDDRSNIKSIDLFLQSLQLSYLVEWWNSDLQIPKIGYMRNWDHVFMWNTIASWLPFTINHKPIRMRYSPLVPRISFDTPEDRACVVSIFQP